MGGADTSTGGTNERDACDFGEDSEKCDGDESLACTPVLLSTGTACARDEDCEASALCFEQTDASMSTGECLDVVGACEPRCAGDFHCADGESCDRFTGECSSTVRGGERFGSSCAEDDDCAGVCRVIDADEAECEENCRVGAESGCGFEQLEGSGVACAFFAYDLSDVDVSQGSGDLGVCADLCDCNDDCPGTQRCLAATRAWLAGRPSNAPQRGAWRRWFRQRGAR
jgi:hypothetical protein